MFIKKSFLIIFLILFSSVFLFAQSQRFNVGEYLLYDVIVEVPELNINGKVGTLESKVMAISNVSGSECYHIRAVVYGDKWTKSIYELHDVFEVWVDTKTFIPKKIVKVAKEGNWTNIETSIFDIKGGYRFIDQKRHPNGTEVKVEQLALDALGLVYYMRFIDKEKKYFDINWLEGANVKDNVSFIIEDGPQVKSVLSILKVDTYRLYESKKYGTDALISKKYNQVPIDVTIAEMKISKYTLRVRGILKKYKEK